MDLEARNQGNRPQPQGRSTEARTPREVNAWSRLIPSRLLVRPKNRPGGIEWTPNSWRVLMLLMLSMGLATLALVSIRSVRSAVLVGGDEGFEVMKGLLWARGFPLYDRIWSDQPPLFTVMLGTLFRWFGPSVGVARSLAVGFGLLLATGCFWSVKQRCGLSVASLAAVYLVVAPYVFELSVSAMQEVPAMATALWAFWPIVKWTESRRQYWLPLSGVILAQALQIKLTAVLVAPALVVEILLSSHGTSWPLRARDAIRNLALWGGAAVVGFWGMAVLLGNGGYDQLWAFHFSQRMLAQIPKGPGLAFSPHRLFEHTEAFLGAVVSLLLILWQRAWRRMAFPLVVLLTMLVVHLRHRPYWAYYYVHFAFPLAWLAAYAAAELLRFVWRHGKDGLFRPPFLGCGSLVVAATLVSLLVAEGGSRLIDEVERIRGLPRVEDSMLVAKLRSYSPRTHWIFTRFTMYAFHAGLSVPPELAVLSSKRFWSGAITDEQVLGVVRRYHPEQLLLSTRMVTPLWKNYIDGEYSLVYEDNQYVLFLVKSLAGN